ncbi:virulence factor family protein [Lysobacter enzymogenes]|uniref:virulence factor family protein n=1 Tax=Lysobacter enzymogenes TaxID=69 RepID=UPI00089702EA|nr:AcvB/VirJ family lysyl-phosphatidylglycerol hydrolase [Lysobacter enzymogenes]SDY21651.1 Type IV secretory pathway, VirJ component [Lysobacter enzymogenes]
MRAPLIVPTVLVAGLCATFAASAATAAAKPAAPAAATAGEITHGRFVRTPVRMPQGEVKRFVLWFADGVDAAARKARADALAADGAMVATVDLAALEAVLRKDGGQCNFSSGDVENFSRYVQAYYRLPTYHLPLLVGDGEGAAFAYAIAAQGNAGLFAGAASVGFCPSLRAAQALCPSGSLKLRVEAKRAQLQPQPLQVPWLLAAAAGGKAACAPAQAEAFAQAVPQARTFKRDARGDALPGLRAALVSLGAQRHASLPPPPADLAGLPVNEMPAQGGGNADTFAVFISGDGGWADVDKSVSLRLAEAGVPVVGVDSLRYFWTPRTPQSFGADLDRIVRYYRAQWKRERVILVGFSQGADVLPGGYNQLPQATRELVRLTALLSPGQKAEYEFHLSNWIGSSGQGLPIAPQVAKMPAAQVLCIYGSEDGDALCPHLPAGGARIEKMHGDHHVDGDYDGVAARVLAAAGIAAAAASAPPSP